MMKLTLCSRREVLVAGFRSTLADSGDLILSVCRDVNELVSCIRKESQEILLLDVDSGVTFDLLREVRMLAPAAPIVLWVDDVSAEFVSQALALGVLGILSKRATREIHSDCLRAVANGQLWVEDELTRKLLGTRQIRLTPRERQIMALLAQGLGNREIARHLDLSEGTVKVYLSKLFEKTGVSDRLELALVTLKNLAHGRFGSLAAKPRAATHRLSEFLLPRFLTMRRA